ncbi:hypothetical protein [Variovorax paradoxus]|uniref:hypothetical protein n=1 Tax=Variovorax paradoxus TaxID=34073 RepID=UPI00247FD93C|nr:hypothetical protein [Variovorax paradoxus]WGT65000.1 hypothetical protein QHG62_06560 [Variovorax paradoxus]
MTSVVDTGVKNFNSTMTGAPVLNGTAGSLVALLDAVLVNGFDLKSANSLTVAGGVATLGFTGSHSAQMDSVIVVAGSSIAALNGEQKVTAIGAGVVKFATAAADGVASGTITIKIAPAGWEKVFSKANVGVYRSLDPASTKMLLRVDDTGTTIARVIGYESMTDADTGVGPFPIAAQVAGGGYWGKSTVANGTANPWAIHADSRLFYFSPAVGVATAAANVGSETRFFGDILAAKPGGDAYACGLSYSTATTANAIPDGAVFSGGSTAGTAFPRSYTALGSAVVQTIFSYVGNQGSPLASGKDNTFGSFPSVIDGAMRLSNKYVTAGTVSPVRGDMPGIYHVPQSQVYDTFKQLDKVPGSGSLAGRVLQAVSCRDVSTGPTNAPLSGNTGIGFIDITGPWR